MSVRLIQTGGAYNAVNNNLYQITNESELAGLTIDTCAIGSVAYLNNPEDGALSKMWMMDNEGNWNAM